jgi:hypothetical protein
LFKDHKFKIKNKNKNKKEEEEEERERERTISLDNASVNHQSKLARVKTSYPNQISKGKKVYTWFLLTSTKMTLANFDCTSLVLFFTPTCT